MNRWRTTIIRNPEFLWHKHVNWQTPPEIVRALGKFDLDPCAAPRQFYRTARVMWKKGDDGLHQEWFGRVWLNPPYTSSGLAVASKKMADHRNGIALLPVKFATKWFNESVIPTATAMLFLTEKTQFHLTKRRRVTRGGGGARG